MAGNISNSQGTHFAVVVGTEIFDLVGKSPTTSRGPTSRRA